jgi:hypothetical protein
MISSTNKALLRDVHHTARSARVLPIQGAWSQEDDAMPSYRDMVELAKICARQARAASNPEVALELRRLAKEYQKKAADLDGGVLPDIE